jgi:hypothetical protein
MQAELPMSTALTALKNLKQIAREECIDRHPSALRPVALVY